MNEAKPIVTCHGNQVLFNSLRQIFCQGLPKQFCEWRRSYGRAPRSVYLDVSCVPYDDDILPDEDERTLVSRPYFHIYWTDCDMDSYKQTVKDDIAEWQAALKNKNIADWLIVVVTSDESKVKAKLLPRSSVIDKVKSDFCSRYPERCITLTDPLKPDSKSSESWSLLFERLRPLLLQAFNQALNKYEESMRSGRERRNEPGWNYFNYFIFQEELAFMLEILGLTEDALVQYDELDAMFDQFVENHANGKIVGWLSPLMEPCTAWAGVSLAKALDHDLREEIKQANISLLEFRNYLFTRQAALLFEMHRSPEVARRTLEFLHHTVAEMRALEVDIPKGALSCWVFLSCLEVLQACMRNQGTTLHEKLALHTANLWDFAHKKLSELGHLCSLMPGLTPTSEQLGLVVDLVSGMKSKEEDITVGEIQTPVDKLRESLSSPTAFKHHYLELCEQAMGTYKYIGRFRSSRRIGQEIANFYVKINEPEKAEVFYVDAIRQYQQEGWNQLADGAMKELALCQKMLKGYARYMKTACHIATSLHLPVVDKEFYFDEFVASLDHVTEELEMRASQAVFIDNMYLNQQRVCIDDTLTFHLDVISNFAKPLTLDTVKISIEPCLEDEVTELQQQPKSQKSQGHRRTPSTLHFAKDQIANFQPAKTELPSNIALRAKVDHQKRRVASAGIICDHSHAILKRTDSSSSQKETTITRGNYSICFQQDKLILQPGTNSLIFSRKMTDEGILKLDQMSLSIGSFHLLKPMVSKNLIFQVVSITPQFCIKPKCTESFIAGIKQEAILTLTSGSHQMPEGSPITFTSSPSIVISRSADSQSESEHPLSIPLLPPLLSCQIPVCVYPELNHDTPKVQRCKIKMSVDCFDNTLEGEIELIHPFRVTHQIMTAGLQKFVQVSVYGMTTTWFELSNAFLTAMDCPDVELVLMNPAGAKYPLTTNVCVTYLWKLTIPVEILPAVDLTFSCQYYTLLDTTQRVFSTSFIIRDFQTQYLLSYDVSSMEEDKSCVTGESAILDIKFKQAPSFPIADGIKLAYTVKADGAQWAIGGKSSGVFTMNEGKHNIALDVVPMQPGFIHFPLVSLYKYLDNIEETSKSEVDDDEDWDNDSALLQSPSQPKVKEPLQNPATARLFEFLPGQVYNQSIHQQIHISPCQTNSSVSVTLTS